MSELLKTPIRFILLFILALYLWPGTTWSEPAYAPVIPGYQLQFPADEGAHPEFRTEWWYVTGWLQDSKNKPLGFQITFFRTRPDLDDANPSSFTPRHILIAHAALSDPAHGRLQHDQRVARAGFNLAEARQRKTDVWIDDWWFKQEQTQSSPASRGRAGEGAVYAANIAARDFQFELKFEAAQPPLLQGEKGFSQKGPDPVSASYYYSLPQLKVSGSLVRGDKREAVTGTAWLDHEWSSKPMDPGAVGWDWIGINLADGGALMAFRMRDKQGETYWAGGAHRKANGAVRVFSPQDIRFTPLRHWRSARSGTSYPVSFRVQAGDLDLTLQPLMDDQENDTRISTGTIYWEGAVQALQGEKIIGSGYLELTGYWKPLRL